MNPSSRHEYLEEIDCLRGEVEEFRYREEESEIELDELREQLVASMEDVSYLVGLIENLRRKLEHIEAPDLGEAHTQGDS